MHFTRFSLSLHSEVCKPVCTALHHYFQMTHKIVQIRKKATKDAEEIGTSKELYNFLYEACNILRGPVSQDAFKEYITPLLYFKRISDVYDEETKAALAISDGDGQQWFVSLTRQVDKSISELRKSIDAIDKVIKSPINENL